MLRTNRLPPLALWFLSFGLAVLVSLLIRLPLFGQVPEGLNRDEAALGYNAYSLQQTGHDEHTSPWPVSITSFGDQKLPGYVYTLIPFIAALDLNPISIRLPSFLAGLVVIAGVGILAGKISPTIFKDKNAVVLTSLVAMILVAISPWGNHFSRVAYEAHLAMAFFVSGLCAYIFARDEKRITRQRVLLIIAAIAWSTTLLTYHSYHILTPLFLLALLGLDWPHVKKFDIIGLISGIAIGILTISLLYFGGVWQANQVKSQGISPFGSQVLREQANSFRQYFPTENSIVEKALFNPVGEGIVRFSQNLITVISGPFLFISGGVNGDHNPGSINNFHVFTALLLVIGLKTAWDHRESSVQLILIWLGLSLIPSSLTIDPQHTIRFSPAFPAIELLAAIGLMTLWFSLKKNWQKKAFLVVVIILVFSSAIRTSIRYLYLIPPTIDGHQRYHLLAQALNKYSENDVQVITQSPTSSPYIWYLVESNYDPRALWDNIEHYPTDGEGFKHVRRIGNVYFETIEWPDLEKRSQEKDLILVFKSSEVPREKLNDGSLEMLEEIYDQRGVLQYQVWRMAKK